MIGILNNWKSKQKQAKPLMVFLNVSGGGIRSASFVMDVLQRLDSITDHRIMPATFMISGASGGMFSATFFRVLYLHIYVSLYHFFQNFSMSLPVPTFFFSFSVILRKVS